MTEQILDTIILNGHQLPLVGIPLDPWLNQHNVKFVGISTATIRGYAATWLILKNRLYLVSCSVGHRHRQSAGTSLPCDAGMAPADWFTGGSLFR